MAPRSQPGRSRPAWTILVLSLFGAIGCGETTLDPIGAALVGAGGSAGAGNGTGGVAITECLLDPNETGYVWQTDCGAIGSWYSYNDCNDSPDDCTQNQLPEEGEFPPSANGMCTTGTTAVPTNQAEASLKWGAGIALDVNYDDETHVKRTLGELGYDFVGVRFDLVTNVPEIRVNFPMSSTETTAHSQGGLDTGTHEVYFKDLEQPPWVAEEDRVTLNPDYIISIQFQIPTEIGVSHDFDYCVDNLTLLL